ncbi:hypothetical protein HAX54_001424 [Datura stramonium]|uniref:Uncharacterized protein n=1 Tax=Datura stramonium TaxID=4076 RepID=A0ABS8T391_DATST|nr:hypothetical protein [Datura stramonium]
MENQIVCLLQSHDLVDFIDGAIQSPFTIAANDEYACSTEEEGDETENNKDYLQWKRSDRFVKGWILGSLTEQLLQNNVVHKDTARDVWLELEQLYSPNSQANRRVNYNLKSRRPSYGSSIERAESIESKKDYSCYLPLYRASLSGDWEKAEAFLKREKEASRAQINSLLQTALHVAVGVKNEKGKHFVERLVATMDMEDLAIRDSLGDTPLHYAARFGNLDAAEILVTRNPYLPHIACFDGLYPIHHAAEYGYISVDVFTYFLRVTTDPAPYTGLNGVRLLNRLIHSDLYDFAWELVEENPDLAKYGSNERSALKELAMKEFTFLSGSRLNFWQQLLYYCIPIRSTSRSHQRRRNANDIENVVNDLQMCNAKYERIYFKTVIKKLDTLLFDVLENLGNISTILTHPLSLFIHRFLKLFSLYFK